MPSAEDCQQRNRSRIFRLEWQRGGAQAAVFFMTWFVANQVDFDFIMDTIFAKAAVTAPTSVDSVSSREQDNDGDCDAEADGER